MIFSFPKDSGNGLYKWSLFVELRDLTLLRSTHVVIVVVVTIVATIATILVLLLVAICILLERANLRV